MKTHPYVMSLILAGAMVGAAWGGEGTKKILLIAGRGSHGFGSHAYKAACMLLAKQLNAAKCGVEAIPHHGWPEDPKALDDAAAVFLCCDGGASRLVGGHVDAMDKLVARGGGVGCLHYTLAEPVGPKADRLRHWIGGAYETHWSVNPSWEAHFTQFPDHPVARGVKPFRIFDEWYYHMRFPPEMKGVTPILSAVPPDRTRKGKDGAHSGNPHVRARMGKAEHVAWVYERPGGGRGFGFTGAHFHWNFGNDGFRTVLLNALVWIAGADVPKGGVPSTTPTVDELLANQDAPAPANLNRGALEKMIRDWKKPPTPAK